MTPDEVTRMAREAGCQEASHPMNPWSVTQEALERFADLVAAHEREKLAAWMMEKGYATGHGDTVEDMLDELEWQVRERGESNGQEAQ